MKGYYTSKLLQDKFYQSLIYSYMDKVINSKNECIYNQFQQGFNKEGEFIYRVIHTRQSAFDEYMQIEMLVNDDGVFVQGERHKDFSEGYLYVLNIFKQKFNKQQTINL